MQAHATRLRLQPAWFTARAHRRRIWHRRRVTLEAALAAFQRLVDALNCARDPALLRAAFADDIALARHAPGERGIAPLVESFTGIAEVERWFARTPPAVQFSLTGAPWSAPDDDRADDPDDPAGDRSAARGGDRWGIEYAYDAGDFHHGGAWIARLACDGRIAQLSHHPFALREPPGAPHAHGGSGHTHGG